MASRLDSQIGKRSSELPATSSPVLTHYLDLARYAVGSRCTHFILQFIRHATPLRNCLITLAQETGRLLCTYTVMIFSFSGLPLIDAAGHNCRFRITTCERRTLARFIVSAASAFCHGPLKYWAAFVSWPHSSVFSFARFGGSSDI